MPCPFCKIDQTRIIIQTELVFVMRDGFPVSDGHTLIIPKRHVGSFFETTQAEKLALLTLIDEAKINIEKEFKPHAYNIGINDGGAAGQTVPHLHIHLIPRYEGDKQDPRGGVRWIIPEKAYYWSKASI